MDPSLAPPGRQLLNFSAIRTILDVKADIADQVKQQIDVLDLLYPGVAENVLWWDVIGGNAIKASSGRFQSDVVGLAQIVGQVGKTDLPSNHRLKVCFSLAPTSDKMISGPNLQRRVP